MDIPADEFDRFAGETDTEFRMLGRYIHAVELGIEKIREEEAADLKMRREKPGTGLLENMDSEIDHIIAHGEEIPRIQKYTQIVALYSLLETRLGLLCEEVNRRQPESDRKPNGFAEKNTVHESKAFLSEPQFSSGITVWEKLDELRIVRNCVAHGNGWIDRIRANIVLRELISSNPGLAEDKGRIVISAIYVENSYRTIYDLLSEAFTNLGFGPGLMPFGS